MQEDNTCLIKILPRFSTIYRQTGVASIEYALIAALIAVAILGALQTTGSTNGGIWGDWTGKLINAVSSAIGL